MRPTLRFLRAASVAVLAAVVITAWILSVWVLLIFFAVPGQVLGWLWVASAMLPAAALGGLVLRLGLRHHRGVRVAAWGLVAVMAVAATGLGVVISGRAIPSTGRLSQEVTRIGSPEGARQISSWVTGTLRCQPTCPIEARLFRTNTPGIAVWVTRLRRAGYRPGLAVARVFAQRGHGSTNGTGSTRAGWYGLHGAFAATVVEVPPGTALAGLLASPETARVELTVQAVRRDAQPGDPR